MIEATLSHVRMRDLARLGRVGPPPVPLARAARSPTLHAVSRPPVLRVSPAVCRRAPERPAHAPNARFRGINHLMRSRLLIAGAAAALAAAALGLGGILRGGGASAVVPQPAAEGLVSRFGCGYTA